MTPLENQTLNHILDLLEKIETHDIYSKLSNSLTGIGEPNKEEILEMYRKLSFDTLTTPINEAKQWLIALLTTK
ncbi:hypothetical protein M0Q39_06705 [Patescibacteria group bacterium]|nr:hypothetical protein [Patescibacteria group bacterium]